MNELTATVLVSQPTTAFEKGQQLLGLLLKHFPRHVPERFGDSEPPKGRCGLGDVETALQAWGHFNFIADRSNPRILLHVLFWPSQSPKPKHSSISLLDFQSERADDATRVSDFVYEASEAFGADYAIAHIFTWTELEDRLETIRQRPAAWPLPPAEQSVARLRQRVEREGLAPVLWSMGAGKANTVKLQKHLPGLSWMTVFGRPYVELFGQEKILSTPATNVRELSNAGIGIELTDGLRDTREDWENFKKVRDRCQAHLDCNAFFNPAMPPGHIYRVPNFQFSQMTKEQPPRGASLIQ